MSKLPKFGKFWLCAALLLSFFPAGCLFFGHKKAAVAKTDVSAAPDKILYDRAVNDYKHGRYTEARLSLQTLINSYPESEYLAKAKLAVADSYYKEGGVEGLTQAVQEYKDFITFFPFLDEASYAQMQVGMSHYRMMGKADRDPTQARLAEAEFQTFLLKYPKNPLVPQAEQRLREVQEILAEGDFDVARFYYLQGDLRASAARLIEVSNRYPLFSQSDRALTMLGDIYRRAARGSKNEQERARWESQADQVYTRLVTDYPLSPYMKEAKARLLADGAKVPPPDPKALQRAEEEQKYEHQHESFIHRSMGVLKSAPNVTMAAHVGEPDLNPPGENESPQTAFEISPGTGTVDLNASAPAGGNATVQTVSPGDSTPPPASSTSTTPDPTTAAAPSPTGPPASTSGAGASSPASAMGNTSAAGSVAGPGAKVVNATNQQSASPADKQGAKGKADKAKESSSKKKKGLRKLIPW